MESRDLVSWTSIIQALSRAGEFALALDSYAGLLADSRCPPPDRLVLLAALKAVAGLIDRDGAARCLEKVRAIHDRAARVGVELDGFVVAALVDSYAKTGSFPGALHVLWSAREIHVVCWTSIVLGAINAGNSRLALELFERMRDEGCQPDSTALLAAIKACANLAGEGQDREIRVLHKGRALHSMALAANLLDLAAANTLIDMYAKCGSLREAIQVFESIRPDRRSIVSWNCLIQGALHNDDPKLALNLYSRLRDSSSRAPNRITHIAALRACASLGDLDSGRQGDSQRVFELFRRMQSREEGIKPDAITYLSVLSACCRSGHVDRAKFYLEEMRSKHGIAPGIEHYTCMVRLLGQANLLEEARKVVETMPVKPDIVIWMALLECCKMWKNLQVGRVAFEGVMRIDDKNATAYVLMSSIYEEAL
ncbi:pentatricopeptide repeat-containing protein At2g22070 [Selaginella moellendorffii]|uniref:pentatricopeptide repeat-containing protein At2g22070 n=1 Tax=Selaginella moellendorffii TaxID=88036 RepID=UPI000D1CD7D6|nr:pentatricopeptide repeat-containing protein At2g22070 [Selaginella moellendorffii]|eukprot:XP_024538047.1 pentatricopeptide repeat-containing protein At2g22070 [Selaginella moellendorffii]